MKARSIAVACAAATLLFAACSSDSKTDSTTAAPTTTAPAAAGDIVAVASANPDFSTLVAAVQAAGLVETLQGAGPYTVFAPTNEAFAKLPAGVVDKLLLPENKDVLAKVLTYHVVAGKVMAADVKAGDVPSVEGSPITVAVDGSTVTLNGAAKVIATDVAASNGVIHVIDSVIVPPDVDVSTL